MDNHEQKAADKQAPKGVEDAAKEYANSHFEKCSYGYTDDKRVTDFDNQKAAFIAGATWQANQLPQTKT